MAPDAAKIEHNMRKGIIQTPQFRFCWEPIFRPQAPKMSRSRNPGLGLFQHETGHKPRMLRETAQCIMSTLQRAEESGSIEKLLFDTEKELSQRPATCRKNIYPQMRLAIAPSVHLGGWVWGDALPAEHVE